MKTKPEFSKIDAAIAFNESRAFYRQFLADMADEIDAALLDFPQEGNDTPSAFGEEAGEVFKAINEFKRAKHRGELGGEAMMQLGEDLYWECVQAAAMALRIAHEGTAAL